MNTVPGIETVASPTHPPGDFLAHESECQDVLQPLLLGLLDMAESAGTAASSLMFLAAQHVSVSGTSANSGS